MNTKKFFFFFPRLNTVMTFLAFSAIDAKASADEQLLGALLCSSRAFER